MSLASPTAQQAALNGLDGTGSTNVMGFVGLNVSSPGVTTAAAAASENANTGSYARAACTWNAASGSPTATKTNATSMSFNTANTVPVTHASSWTSGTYGAGTYGVGFVLGSSVQAAVILVAPGALSIQDL